MSDDERRTLLKLLENGLLRGKCRRGYFRKSLRLPVTFAVGQRAHRNFIRDISLSGVFIVTGIPFQVGEQLRIVLRDKDNNNPVKILGRIARVTAEGIGVEFFALNNAKKTAILSLASAG
jgi:c-di-GMP-binding flagellar brake protein YcgR